MAAHSVPVGQKWWSGGRSPFNVEYGKLMMWYFLMSDAFTFGAFLISYGSIRFSSTSWPNPNEVFKSFPVYGEMTVPLAFVSLMTFILIMSSVTMVMAVGAGQMQDRKAERRDDHQQHDRLRQAIGDVTGHLGRFLRSGASGGPVPFADVPAVRR